MAEYMAKSVEESDFGSKPHGGMEAFVIEASTASACCDFGVGGGKLVEMDLMQVQLVSMGHLGGMGMRKIFHGIRDENGGSSVEGTVSNTMTALAKPGESLGTGHVRIRQLPST